SQHLVTDQPARMPEEHLAHWHDELARVLKASPTLTWPNLIDWAEEAEHFALKACTKSGRARLAHLEQQTEAAEAEVKRLTRELEQARAAKLAEAEPRLAAMQKLAAAWQKEAERARKDTAVPADMADVAEMRIWDALERPLTMEEVAEHIKILRGVRNLAVHAIEIASGTFTEAKKRVLDAAEAGPPSDTAIPGEWENGWDAAMETVRNALENKEPTT
ncbi:hypothetical protein, partial [Streptomyces sp. EN23]